MMDFQNFKSTLKDSAPPPDLSEAILAMWYAGKNDWNKAHDIAQDIPTKEGSWIHAYLHRVEGDQWNADYWYRRADRSSPDYDLAEEWEVITKFLLEH